MNLVALWLLPLVMPVGSVVRFWLVGGLLSLWISLGVFWLQPQLDYYAGLSGVLHGWYLWAALNALFYPKERLFAAFLIAAIVLKLAIEVSHGALSNAQLVGAPIAIFAHQWGVFGGFLLFLLEKLNRYIFKR